MSLYGFALDSSTEIRRNGYLTEEPVYKKIRKVRHVKAMYDVEYFLIRVINSESMDMADVGFSTRPLARVHEIFKSGKPKVYMTDLDEMYRAYYLFMESV